jgi:muconolactone delta-isomerase
MTEPCESYRAAWDRAAELQKKGYITRVWRDARGWNVKAITLAEWEAKQNGQTA